MFENLSILDRSALVVADFWFFVPRPAAVEELCSLNGRDGNGNKTINGENGK